MRNWLPGCCLLLAAGVAGACGGDDVTCGSGTKLVDGTCVASGTGGGNAGSGGSTAGSGGEAGSAGGSGGSQAGSGGTSAGGSSSTGAPPKFDGVQDVAPASATSLQVAWAAATDDKTAPESIRYNVYAAASDMGQAFGTPQVTSAPGATSVLLTNLDADTEYFVVVRAEDSDGMEDANNDQQSGTTAADTTAPTFDGVQAAEAAGAAQVKLTWNAATDDLTGAAGMRYVVYYGVQSPVDLDVPSQFATGAGATEAIVKVPEASSTYYFVVQALDAAGNSSGTTTEVEGASGADVTAPSFGGCTLAETASASELQVHWAPAKDDTTAADELKYQVFASPTSGAQNFATPAAEFTDVTSGLVGGLQPDTEYYVVCRAVDKHGNADENTTERIAKTLDDSTPPVFSGVTTVTSDDTGSMDVSWDAATDDKTATADIVYEVYVANTTGGQMFDVATQITDPGVTTLNITGLQPAQDQFVVVRAVDQAGNKDTNTVEGFVRTNVSFAFNIQSIFTANCTFSGCHDNNGQAGLVLTSGFSYSQLLGLSGTGEPSTQKPSLFRVNPGNADDSYLYDKITNDNIIGLQMPNPLSGIVLSQQDKDNIRDWIDQGAKQN